MTDDWQLKQDCMSGIRKECQDIIDATHRISKMLAHMDAKDACFERDKDIIRAVFALRRALGEDV